MGTDGLDLLEEQVIPRATPERKLRPLQADTGVQNATAISLCHPDRWDVSGRLISNDHNNPR